LNILIKLINLKFKNNEKEEETTYSRKIEIKDKKEINLNFKTNTLGKSKILISVNIPNTELNYYNEYDIEINSLSKTNSICDEITENENKVINKIEKNEHDKIYNNFGFLKIETSSSILIKLKDLFLRFLFIN